VTKEKTIKSTVRAKSQKEAVQKLKSKLIKPKDWVPVKTSVTDATREFEVTFRKRKKRKRRK